MTAKPSSSEVKSSGPDGSKDERFIAFQSNLLSLVSHELRTPLTGVLNALTLLSEEGASGQFSQKELVETAQKNAVRLQNSLATILDWAAIQSGAFQPRLREVSLRKLWTRSFEENEVLLKEKKVKIKSAVDSVEDNPFPVLADPQKLGRAFDLVLDLVGGYLKEGGTLSSNLTDSLLTVDFELDPDRQSDWEKQWEESNQQHDQFFTTMMSEEQFLARSHEGLGNLSLLIRKIIESHDGILEERRDGELAGIRISLPVLDRLERFEPVLVSRVYETSTGLSSTALCLLNVPENGDPVTFRRSLRKCLFRSTDAAYALPDRNLVALVLDDCKPDDAPILLERIAKSYGGGLKYGWVVCPEDGTDPKALIALAEKRLKSAKS